jgi:hypothetical protein
MFIKKISFKQYVRLEGLLWVLLGGALCFGGSRLGFGTLDRPESGFMSLVMGSLLVLFGFMIMLPIVFAESDKKETISGGLFQKVKLYAVLALIVYGFLLNLLGFLVSTFLLLVFLFKILSPQKWFFHIFLSLITVILSYLLFHVWLRIDFPQGIFHIG